jgi:hypothetical protein
MKKSRKKRAPKILIEEVKARKQDTSRDFELERRAARFVILEKLMQDKVLNVQFIALESLSAIASDYLAGKTEEAIRKTWPQSWGDETICVPLPLVLALSDAWASYRAPDSNQSLGEAFHIEGRGQGKPPMKDALSNLNVARRHANDVEIAYIAHNNGGAGASLEQVYEEIADAEGIAPETVKKHHRKHKEEIRNILIEIGVLKGP